MRLIEDHRIGGAEKVAETVLLQREIGKQQVMVDDDEVRRLRVAPCRHHMTARVVRAALTQAVVAGRGDLRPDRLGLGHAGHFGQIARLRDRRPRLEPRQQGLGHRDALEHALRELALEAVGTKIVATPFEEGHPGGTTERAGDQRHILGVELILQRAGAGRNQHAPPGEQRRHQISEGLTGAGTRFDQERGAVLERVGDRARHLQLGTPGSEARQAPGQGPVGTEDVVDILHRGRHANRCTAPCRALNLKEKS